MTEVDARFLASHIPFSFLKEEELQILVRQATTQTFKRGEAVLRANEPPPKCLYVVYKGLLARASGAEVVEYLSPGETSCSVSLLSDTPVKVDIFAEEDSACILIPGEDFLGVFNSNNRFSQYFLNLLERKLTSLYKLSQKEFVSVPERYLTVTKVGEAMAMGPVTCSPTTSIREAASTMQRERVGSVVVVDEIKKPVGILTTKDLRDLVAKECEFDKPISNVMSAPVAHVNEGTTLYEAYLALISGARNHLVVVDDAMRVKGIVTAKDLLLAMDPAYSLSTISRRVIRANSVGELKKLHAQTIDAIMYLLNRGVSYQEMAKVITEVNDMITRRAIELAETKLASNGLWRPVRYAWIEAGSAGRKEQTLRTDQDNAIIYDDSTDSQGKELIRELAVNVTDTLEQLGIPRCIAGYMASNSKWTKSLIEWMRYFDTWKANPNEMNLVHLNLFLDSRPVYGDEQLANAFKTYAFERRAGPVSVARALADSVVSIAPFGLFGRVSYGKKGFDIKGLGLFPIVNGVKALALDARIMASETIERLDLLMQRQVLDRAIGEPAKEAYQFLSTLRLKHQLNQLAAGLMPDNYIKSGEINNLEAAILKECLKIMADFQAYLKTRYNLAELF